MPYTHSNEDPIITTQTGLRRVLRPAKDLELKTGSISPTLPSDVSFCAEPHLHYSSDIYFTESKAFHQCSTVDGQKLNEFYNKSSIMKLFVKHWDVEPYLLPHVCTYNRDVSNFRFYRHNSQKRCSDYTTISPFWIPTGMPFMVTDNPLYGIVFTTPFFSVIPRMVPETPESLFSLSTLKYEGLHDNIMFRHELAFNPSLTVEFPESTVSALNLDPYWRLVIIECAEKIRNPVVHAPLALLPVILEKGKQLCSSVCPEYRERIEYTMSTEILLESDNANFWQDLVSLLIDVIKKIINPRRRRWLREAEVYFEDCTNPQKLVAGIKIVIELLLTTKLERINVAIKQNVQELLDSSGICEESYYNYLVETLVVKETDFMDWFAVYKPRKAAVNHMSFVLQLTTAFLTSLISHEHRITVPRIFELDKKRILRMQDSFDRLLAQQIQNELTQVKPATQALLHELIENNRICTSPFGKLVESRLIAKIYEEVESMLNSKVVKKEGLTKLQRLASKIAVMISLHFAGASKYYRL